MNREQIEKWAREAEAYAQRNASHDVPHHVVFNTEFARLVHNAALEEAKDVAWDHECGGKDDITCQGQNCGMCISDAIEALKVKP